MKKINLTKGYFTLVDDEFFDILSQFKWRVNISKSGNKYAIRSWYDKESKLIKSEKMHRRILNLIDSKMFVDHINGDGLDNRKENLRITNAKGNAQNAIKMKRKNTSSRFKGVSLSKKDNRWIVCVAGKYVGCFENEITAAKIYNKVALSLFGEFALLNVFEGETNETVPDTTRTE